MQVLEVAVGLEFGRLVLLGEEPVGEKKAEKEEAHGGGLKVDSSGLKVSS